MNIQNTNLKKTAFTPVLTVTLLSVIAALLLVISLFLPMVKVLGISLTLQQVEEFADQDGVFVTFLIPCAISLLWAVLPKKWAAIVGAIYGIFPIFLCLGQTLDWHSKDHMSPLIGSILMSIFSITVFVLSVAKLVVLLKNQKKAPVSAVMNQPTLAAR